MALFVTSPAILAHGPIAQSDMCVTPFSLLALGATWRMLNRPTVVGTVVAGITLAGAFLSKHSALLLLPTFVLLLTVRTWHACRRPCAEESACRMRRTLRTLGRGIGLLLLQGAVGIGVLWASYGFRYSAFPRHASDSKFQADWAWAFERRDTVTGTVEFCHEHRLLPEVFLHGAAFMHQRNTYRPGFLCGTYYESGTAWFLPYCWLLKTPPGHVAIVGLAAIGFVYFAVRRRRRQTVRLLYQTAPPWVFAVLFSGIVVVSRFNTGDRYFFPIYAPLMILVGVAARYARHRNVAPRGVRQALRIGLALAVGSSVIDAVPAIRFYDPQVFALKSNLPQSGGACSP